MEPKKRTWGRELALSILVSFMILVAMTAWRADVTEAIELIKILWLPVMALVGGAFGIKNFAGKKPGDSYPEGVALPEREYR